MPPIGNGLTEDISLTSKKRGNNRLKWDKPSPPPVILLHVAIVAQTHNLVEYQQHYLSDYNSYYVDRYDNFNF